MNLLFVCSFTGNKNIHKSQIELILILNKLSNKLVAVGNFSDDVLSIFTKNKIQHTNIYPKKKFDKEYAKQINNIIIKNNINLVQFLNGKASRSILHYNTNKSVKFVSYFGSISLHWYDFTSYFTYLSPKLSVIICNSNFVYNHVKNQLFGNNKQKAKMIYKGYSSSWFTDVKSYDYTQLNIPTNAIKVCLVGNHRKVKGIEYFINSFKHIETNKEVHFIVVGNKTNSEKFKNLQSTIPNGKCIHLLGARKDALSLIKGADIYVQTSLSEGLGRAISEAMSLEKPIVMTNAGGCTELIDKDSGIVVPLKNPPEIANAISKLINNEELRLSMGSNAKKRIDTTINIQKNAEEYYKLYKNLLKDS